MTNLLFSKIKKTSIVLIKLTSSILRNASVPGKRKKGNREIIGGNEVNARDSKPK